MIKKIDGKFFVYDKDGKKNLGKKDGYATKAEADKRLREIEFFKQNSEKKAISFVSNVSKSQIFDTGEYYELRNIPVTVDGAIMNGIRYKAEDNKAGMPTLNGKVVTLAHPSVNGQPIDAYNGEALQRHFSGGIVTKTYNVDGVNYVDASVKKSVLEAQDYDDKFFSNALANKRDIGVSTGLLTNLVENDDGTIDATEQEYNHLAMLHESEAPAGGDATFMRFNSDGSMVVNVDDIIALKGSSNEIRQSLDKAIREKIDIDDDSWLYIRDHGDDHVVFSVDSTLYIAQWGRLKDGSADIVIFDISEAKEKSVFSKINSAFTNAISKIFDRQNNDSHNDDEHLNNNEDSSMREAHVAALAEASITVNAEASDGEVLAKYNEMQAAKLAKTIADNMAKTLKPITESVEALTAKVNAQADKDKADLVNAAVKFGINEETAKGMSIDALQIIANKSGAMQTNGLNAAYQPAQNSDLDKPYECGAE